MATRPMKPQQVINSKLQNERCKLVASVSTQIELPKHFVFPKPSK